MKQLGIMIDKISDERLEGALVYIGSSISLDDDNYIKVEEEIKRTKFTLTLGSKKILEVAAGTDIGHAAKVLNALVSIGYKSVVLEFNGKEYEAGNEDEP